MENKTLTKSTTDKRVAGVAGGLAEYFDVDPALVRLAFVLFTFLGGPGVIIYIVLALVLPESETVVYSGKAKNDDQQPSMFVG
ncbi:MAG: PspC domain-containing protein [Chloroflexota bacterium]